ncbi:myotubularin-related protein 1, putative [Candida dubliniensis CD36]|uniref:Phosphoinositide 3-phosphatase, putative n=1 Tax=Candida dubliniensis (strain CD36 / ATCC MYA-646 / CBS 7987 / NCPF 3949 / NRRL Y-17841) TaxID=573826 RepID=B9W8R2_CANDC|nr:myotubularin-related protein 1, putative [Candida dubliniensis CD36]CAX45135.1 myotubularin-related protein 1, putative [Candida dubliniensis CD36]
MENVFKVENVILNRRGYHIPGILILSSFHLVFSFTSNASASTNPKEIWICYPMIEKISKARGSSWINHSNGNTIKNRNAGTQVDNTPKIVMKGFDHYSASHIRLQCKDFTYYSFDFMNDLICSEVFTKLSSLITISKTENDIRQLYAYSYKPNMHEQNLDVKGWQFYDPIEEYKRLELVQANSQYWRVTTLNTEYKFSPSYPKVLIVPSTISDNVLKHAGKFRSKQRIPAIVYKHKSGINGNVIARCAQPLVGLNIQNRSIQDEKLIGEIFLCQERERRDKIDNSCGSSNNVDDEFQREQPQRNLLVDLRPVTNAMAQHALGAGTENVDYYRGRSNLNPKDNTKDKGEREINSSQRIRHIDKIFCNIDNIHVMRDAVNKLSAILNDLDRYPATYDKSSASSALLQQALTKTQWLNRLSIILQSVDRITKSIHLNNTNVIIHCSDGWDRTSQVSALSQLCLDPFYRTLKGFMILVEKEWTSFGFKFATRADHGGCIGAIMKKEIKSTSVQDETNQNEPNSGQSLESSMYGESSANDNSQSVTSIGSGAAASVSSFFQRAARAAREIKNTAQNGLSSSPSPEDGADGSSYPSSASIYNGSNEKSPIFHQFLDCVYQIYRQNPTQFEFNSRFLKRLFYHYYSCQYGTFLCDSEKELYEVYKVQDSTVSVWDYFNSRPSEFLNNSYAKDAIEDNDGVIFFNFADLKWWFELYGRSDEEMNGLSNSLDRKFAQMGLNRKE